MIATHLGAIGCAHAENPDALWDIVSTACVPDPSTGDAGGGEELQDHDCAIAN